MRNAGPRVSIIIISYNTKDLTLECIASVYRETGRMSFELIVVDNASSDGSPDAIGDKFPPDDYPSLRLIALDQNLGFAAANNLAGENARGAYLLLLNPDTIVLDQALERLVEYADANPSAGIYGGATLFPDGRRNPTAGWMKPTLWSMFCVAVGLARLFPRSRFFNGESLAGRNWERPMQVDIVTGCLLLIRSRDWDRLGGFDPAFFMYGEDADLCLRAAALGMRPVLVPNARIVHYGGASEPVRSDKMVRLFRAKVQLLATHYSRFEGRIMKALLLANCLVRLSLFTIAHVVSKRERGRSVEWKGVWNRRAVWFRHARIN